MLQYTQNLFEHDRIRKQANIVECGVQHHKPSHHKPTTHLH
jgi:hypothetical protein